MLPRSLAVVHYYWLVKSDVRLPLFYAALVALLLGYRLTAWLRGRRTRRPASTPTRPRQAQPAAG